jgi:hypothetical protein
MSTINVLEEAARAWFPAPEFRYDTSRNFEHMTTYLRITHMPSRWAIDQNIDEAHIADVQDPKKLAMNIMERLAEKMHFDLALKGFGEPVNIGGYYDMAQRPWVRREGVDDWEAKRALMQICDLILIEREAQGLGHLLYMVRRGKWAQKISTEMLDKPLEWWQAFISSQVGRNDFQVTS